MSVVSVVSFSRLADRVVDFGRDICSDPAQSGQREWLITNGIGGYGCGTISGMLTRCYHGWLVAALKPPLGRTLLLTKLDEVAQYQNLSYPLSCDRWAGGTTTGHGYRHLERFYLAGSIPTWHYACADARLQKQIWMQPGENTTYVQYQLQRASAPFVLSLKAIVNYRDHHSVTQRDAEGQAWQFRTRSHPRGLKIEASEQASPFYLLTSKGQLMPAQQWYQHYFLAQEKYRGLVHLDDHLHVATLRVTLAPGESLTFAASTEPFASLDGPAVLTARVEYEQGLIKAYKKGDGEVPGAIAQLVLAADQFIVDRAMPTATLDEELPIAEESRPGPIERETEKLSLAPGKTVIAGYPWFGDWGRDTMIALPGLTLATGRAELAGPILRTFGRFLSQGMLPNVFPEANDTPGYNTVDAILWYFEAIRAYLAVTEDLGLLEGLYPALVEVIDWHLRGTRYHIGCDRADGLLFAGEPGTQLTWMDAKVDSWVVTPRIGKAVEINALWHNALGCMAQFARQLGQSEAPYQRLLAQAGESFSKFWQPQAGYCFDVIDGPEGNDPALRPNQLFAVSLAYAPPLSLAQQKAIVDRCAQELLTSHGLRSLAPGHRQYIGTYGGDRYQRDGAYHQGTVWAWLIGPFVQAHFKVYQDRALALSFLEPLMQHLQAGCVGTMSEIFDGEAPFAPRGAFAQAWSVAEVLRVWQWLEAGGGR